MSYVSFESLKTNSAVQFLKFFTVYTGKLQSTIHHQPTSTSNLRQIMFCRSILTYTTNLRAYSRNRNLGDVLVKQIQSEVLNFRHGPVSETIDVNGDDLTLEQLISLGGDKKISISSATIKRLKRSRNAVDKIISVGDPVYGINTGFGVMSNVNIPEQDLLTLQKNLIRSHASGTWFLMYAI